jgi:Mn-dependent DtxR family transcriptional regulator
MLLYNNKLFFKLPNVLGGLTLEIQESGENYLETILILHNKNGSVRSIDIANELGYTKASISRAMSILKKAEYIAMEKTGEIVLTEKGIEKANSVYERHRLISRYLVLTLNIDKSIADQDACRIEHVISQETFNKIKEFINNNN